jgi:hypothetical protein
LQHDAFLYTCPPQVVNGSKGSDVLQAPHHGSRKSNTPVLAAWARPQVVISCQGPPPGGLQRADPYTPAGGRFLGTWPHGAVTVRSHRPGLVVERYHTRARCRCPAPPCTSGGRRGGKTDQPMPVRFAGGGVW